MGGVRPSPGRGILAPVPVGRALAWPKVPEARSQNEAPVALVALGALTALFVWWAWKQGAYFGPVFYPGAIAIFAFLAMLLVASPRGLSLDGPAAVTLAALAGIAALTLLSLLWTSVPGAALAYGERIFVYAAVFAMGAWATGRLGRRLYVALLPVALTGVLVGLATLAVLAVGSDITWYLQGDATLRFPIGYRNADMAFLLICLWPLLGLATENELRWPLRALAVAGGTVLVNLAILGQSRGSLPALAMAALVFLALSPHRLRAGVVLVLVVVPALPFLSDLLAVFRYNSPDSGIVPLLHTAARAGFYSAGISLLLASFALGLVYPRLRLGEQRVRAISLVAGVLAAVVAVAGVGAFVARHGGPVGFVDQRLDEFGRTGYPNLHGQGVRFGANVGSNRHDFWRVAVDEGLDHPLLGGGAGSFQLAYQHHRESLEEPHDPHSIEAAIFSELGFPGLLLLLLFLGSAAWAALRSWRTGPLGAALVAAAAAGATQWFVHGSWDWFWQYAGVSVLGIYLLGAAAGPGLRAERPPQRASTRWPASLALVSIAVMAVPLFLSDRYLQRAREQAGRDPAAAIADASDAADLNPYADEPLIVRGQIQSGLGRSAAAVASFRAAAEREPDNFVSHYFVAEELLRKDPAAAATALRRAAALNPKAPQVRALRRELAPRAGAGDAGG